MLTQYCQSPFKKYIYIPTTYIFPSDSKTGLFKLSFEVHEIDWINISFMTNQDYHTTAYIRIRLVKY